MQWGYFLESVEEIDDDSVQLKNDGQPKILNVPGERKIQSEKTIQVRQCLVVSCFFVLKQSHTGGPSSCSSPLIMDVVRKKNHYTYLKFTFV